MDKIKTKNDLLVNYGTTRTDYLDSSAQDKLDWFKFYFENVYKKYFEGLDTNVRILDLGCNRGYLLKTISDYGFTDLHGVDLSTADIKVAKNFLMTAHFYEQDIFQFLERNKDKFDVIILKAVIEHIEKDRVVELLSLISRNLSKTGFLFIDVYNADWLFSHHDRYMDFTHESGFTKESLHQVMVQVFKSVSVSSVASPIKNYNPSPLRLFRGMEKYEYRFLRWIVKYVVESIEPEMQGTPFLDRSLIARGSNDI